MARRNYRPGVLLKRIQFRNPPFFCIKFGALVRLPGCGFCTMASLPRNTPKGSWNRRGPSRTFTLPTGHSAVQLRLVWDLWSLESDYRPRQRPGKHSCQDDAKVPLWPLHRHDSVAVRRRKWECPGKAAYSRDFRKNYDVRPHCDPNSHVFHHIKRHLPFGDQPSAQYHAAKEPEEDEQQQSHCDTNESKCWKEQWPGWRQKVPMTIAPMTMYPFSLAFNGFVVRTDDIFSWLVICINGLDSNQII